MSQKQSGFEATNLGFSYDGKAIFFTHPVRYELPDNKLIAIG